MTVTLTQSAESNELIDLGNGVKVGTGSSDVELHFHCAYATTIEVTSAEFEVQSQSVVSGMHGTGTLDAGFSLTIAQGDTVILGSDVEVTASWEVTTLSDLSFYF